MPRFLSLLRQFGARLVEPALRNVAYIERRLAAFAILAIVTFPLYYYVWEFVFPQRYESLTLRLVGSVLFLPMLFASQWPDWMRRWLPYYWYFALLYSLPFFFSFMLLKNNGADVWIGSALVAVFVMILLLDWVTLIGQFLLGSGLAYLAFSLTSDGSLPAFARWDYVAIAGFAVVAGAVTNYDAERIRIEQERAMLATAGSIAHELRTPLLGIRAGAAGLANYLPTLIEAYQLAQTHGLPVESIRTAHLDSLRGVLERIDSEARQSNAIIDMMLVNARSAGAVKQALQPCSIAACVETALRRYPFSDEERRLVSWDKGDDFDFRGVELLMVHVLFNLIKNALRHIAHAGKGEIRLRIEAGDHHRLIVRDSGGGIPSDALPHIFERFYTSTGDDTVLGAGIGLAFCRDVMGAFGGTISCDSVHGEYSQFELDFPAA
ncbi:MAG: HAMP domain-containing histidine kinase [Rhodocyclales bacterium]|nr:HAMP domain-containing histidine kinase [Rhodocyclales bacterium]